MNDGRPVASAGDAPKRPSRLDDLREAMRDAGLAGAVLAPGADLTYLSGASWHPSERPILVVIPSDGPEAVLHPELERGEVSKRFGPDAIAYVYGDDDDPFSTWCQLVSDRGMERGAWGVSHRTLRLVDAVLLDAAKVHRADTPLERLVDRFRTVKDDREQASLAEAVAIAERSLAMTLATVRLGVSEREVQGALIASLMAAGSEPLPKLPVVTFGARTAHPHATASDARLADGELVMIDTGARSGGMASDVTRTFRTPSASVDWTDVHAVVVAAIDVAVAVVEPDAPIAVADRAARKLISDAGFGAWFPHRVGHGIGIEGHEVPYLTSTPREGLCFRVGMTFTLEPGIYLPRRGGVRVEQNVVLREDGAHVLNRFPTGLGVIGGGGSA